MKISLRLLLLATSALGISLANTACTPTEAALVGAAAGAVVGYAVADDHNDETNYHGGSYYSGNYRSRSYYNDGYHYHRSYRGGGYNNRRGYYGGGYCY
ncbi:MAG: hypothetical protein CMO61_09760 [Verrucomicrobiales bacterium]|nr:hypothetical protein [Verrucomicrobiales bacterium]